MSILCVKFQHSSTTPSNRFCSWFCCYCCSILPEMPWQAIILLVISQPLLVEFWWCRKLKQSLIPAWAELGPAQSQLVTINFVVIAVKPSFVILTAVTTSFVLTAVTTNFVVTVIVTTKLVQCYNQVGSMLQPNWS